MSENEGVCVLTFLKIWSSYSWCAFDHFSDALLLHLGERKKRNHIHDAEVNSRVNDADIVADEELANSENETVNLIT